MAKHETLPGVENGNVIKEISDAAEEYENLRDNRMDLLKKEIAANATLVTLMQKHKMTVYRDENYDPPLVCTVSAKDPTVKVKVKRETEKMVVADVAE